MPVKVKKDKKPIRPDEEKRSYNSLKKEYWRSEDGLLLLEAWARDGLNETEITSKMGINRATLYRWKEAYPDVAKALATGKEIVDYKVENALLKSALGFTTKEIKVTLGKKVINGEVYNVLKETTTKEIAPNVTAAMFWLNNRKYDQWKKNRDKIDAQLQDDPRVEIKIVKGKGLGDEVNDEVTIKTKGPVNLDKEEKDLNDWSDWDGEE